jgi:hypothetical protein
MFSGNKIHVRVLEPATDVSVTSSSMSVMVPEDFTYTGTDIQSIDLTSSSITQVTTDRPQAGDGMHHPCTQQFSLTNCMVYSGKYETISEDHIDSVTDHQASVLPSLTATHDLNAINLLSGVEQHVYDSDYSDVSVASSSMSVSVPEDFVYTDTNDQSTVVPALPIPPAHTQPFKRRKRGKKGGTRNFQ